MRTISLRSTGAVDQVTAERMQFMYRVKRSEQELKSKEDEIVKFEKIMQSTKLDTEKTQNQVRGGGGE